MAHAHHQLLERTARQHRCATRVARQQPVHLLARGPAGRRAARLAGVGAGGFDTARTRYTTTPTVFAHAHSYLIETFADFGLIGLVVSLALLLVRARACRRTLALAPGVERSSPERIGLIPLLSVVVIFGVSSLIDWTWFVPGVAVPGLWPPAGSPAAGRSLPAGRLSTTARRRTMGPIPARRESSAHAGAPGRRDRHRGRPPGRGLLRLAAASLRRLVRLRHHRDGSW